MHDARRSATVSALFGTCRPADISRLISLIVVDTVYRVLGGWLRANVRKERFEAIPPFVADSNSTTTVVVVSVGVRVVAAFSHRRPGTIFGCTSTDSGSAVGCPTHTREFGRETTATLSVSKPEASRRRHELSAALTQAFPIGGAISWICAAKHRESCEDKSGQVFRWSPCRLNSHRSCFRLTL